MTRWVWHYDKGKKVDGPAPRRPHKSVIPNEGDTGRGFSFQLPRNYKYASRFTDDGRPCWTTKQEGEDMVKRAQDAGEPLHWDRSRDFS